MEPYAGASNILIPTSVAIDRLVPWLKKPLQGKNSRFEEVVAQLGNHKRDAKEACEVQNSKMQRHRHRETQMRNQDAITYCEDRNMVDVHAIAVLPDCSKRFSIQDPSQPSDRVL